MCIQTFQKSGCRGLANNFVLTIRATVPGVNYLIKRILRSEVQGALKLLTSSKKKRTNVGKHPSSSSNLNLNGRSDPNLTTTASGMNMESSNYSTTTLENGQNNMTSNNMTIDEREDMNLVDGDGSSFGCRVLGIPQKGTSEAEIIHQIKSMKGDETKVEEGKTFAYVYTTN